MKKTIKEEKIPDHKHDGATDRGSLKELCSLCQGSGLWNPDYTNSPQCDKCMGHGFINLEK